MEKTPADNRRGYNYDDTDHKAMAQDALPFMSAKN
jgi:hypothetical protein